MIGKFIRFGLVGAVGFIVDASVLIFLVKVLTLAPLPGRIISFLTAATVTFVLNQRFTFKLGESFSLRRWFYYVTTTAAGALVNVGVYELWIRHFGTSALDLALGAAVGSLAAMTINFSISNTWVFQNREHTRTSIDGLRR